jgi:hypothetical protein
MEDRGMLNWRVVTQSLASFFAITFVLCVAYGVVVPPRFHPAWLLETVLPGFTWLTATGFLVGIVEAALYGAWAGILYSALHNFFTRRAERRAAPRISTARAA